MMTGWVAVCAECGLVGSTLDPSPDKYPVCHDCVERGLLGTCWGRAVWQKPGVRLGRYGHEPEGTAELAVAMTWINNPN